MFQDYKWCQNLNECLLFPNLHFTFYEPYFYPSWRFFIYLSLLKILYLFIPPEDSSWRLLNKESSDSLYEDWRFLKILYSWRFFIYEDSLFFIYLMLSFYYHFLIHFHNSIILFLMNCWYWYRRNEIIVA